VANKQQWFSYKPKSCSSFMDFFCSKLVKYPFCKICSFTCQKEKSKKKHFSSHKVSKQQMTSFWSQGILRVKFVNKNLFEVL
jgi:hypothetical protein